MIGTLYVSSSTSKGSEEFSSIPFSNASIDWKRDDASTMSFNSPFSLEESWKVRYASETGDFGGQIYKRKKSTSGDFQYEAISYTRLYHDKVTCDYKNKTSAQILRKVLKLSKNDFRTSGIKDTDIVHSYLKWENTSIYDIALQLAWLEQQIGFQVLVWVDADGTLNFKYAPQQQNGYSFTSVFDYEEEYDSSDLITASQVTYNGKVLASTQASKDILAKWGYVTEVDECQAQTVTSNTTSTNTTNAKAGGSSKLKDEASIQKYNIPKSIVDQALSIAKEGKSDYDNLKLLYNWCNKHIDFDKSGYYNTKYGAAGTLKRRCGNCCDNAHVLIAMARTIGIKCRYCHGNNGKAGHVWGEYKVNGKWIVVDTGTRSTTKYFGSHWNGAGGCDDRHDVLPF